MGLINLTTDLKSLRYGKDRIGGGDSGQPYIKSNIPDDLSPYIGTQDYLNRGGIRVVRDSATDVLRLGKMFVDTKSPNGIFFASKQNLLSRTAVRTQTSGVLNEGNYSPLNTLAQAGVVAFGSHLNKQGDPFADSGAYSNNESLYGVKVKYTQPSDENRLAILLEANLKQESITKNGITYNNPTVNVMTYLGGPGSNLGIGNTNIRYASPEQRTGINNPLFVNNPGQFYGKNHPGPEQTEGKTYNPINSQITNSGSIYKDLFKVETSQRDNQGNQTWYNDVYNTGSLDPYGPIVLRNGTFSQTQRPNGRTTLLFKSPLGVSDEWVETTGEKDIISQPFLSTGGGYTNELRNKISVYSPKADGTFPETTDRIFDNGTFTYNQKDIISPYEITSVSPDDPTTSPTQQGSIASPKIQDFRAVLRKKSQSTQKSNAEQSGAIPEAPNYNKQNIEKRVLLGDPGQRSNKSYVNYEKGVEDTSTGQSAYSSIDIPGLGPYQPGLDKITSIPVYRSKEVASQEYVNDLCKFRIAVIDNNSPNFKTFMHFRAFLGPMSDSYTAKWGAFNYLGRGEDFYTYNGFTRTISLSWTVAAQSKQELIPMYKKLNYLASSLTPDYGPSANGSGYMRGNLVQLTVGGYLYEQPGFITSLTYDIQEDTPWEIGINSNELGGDDSSVKELPHIIRVTGFNFTPIQTFLPRLQVNGFGSNQTTPGSGFANSYGDQRYIALSDGDNNNYNEGNTGGTGGNRRRVRVEAGPLTIPFGDT
jgi:hypothetical protein